jgi:hypothetical protein
MEVFDNELYKICISGLLLRCVSKVEGQEILQEVHTGIYGGHIDACPVATMVLRQGFY